MYIYNHAWTYKIQKEVGQNIFKICIKLVFRCKMLLLASLILFLTNCNINAMRSGGCLAFIPGQNCGSTNPIKMRKYFSPQEMEDGCVCLTEKSAAEKYKNFRMHNILLPLTLQVTAQEVVIIFTQRVPKSVRMSIVQEKQKRCCQENKLRAMTNTLHENNDHHLAGAWWVILNSRDLFSFYLNNKSRRVILKRHSWNLKDKLSFSTVLSRMFPFWFGEMGWYFQSTVYFFSGCC